MNYESVMWVLTVVVATVLVLIALTNVFAQVVKKLIKVKLLKYLAERWKEVNEDGSTAEGENG